MYAYVLQCAKYKEMYDLEFSVEKKSSPFIFRKSFRFQQVDMVDVRQRYREKSEESRAIDVV